MSDLNSSHGGTFSEGIPNYNFLENMEDFSKCPNCEGENYKSGYCFDCGEGYSNKEKIFQIIENDNKKHEKIMTADEIAAENKYIRESRGKERRIY